MRTRATYYHQLYMAEIDSFTDGNSNTDLRGKTEGGGKTGKHW